MTKQTASYTVEPFPAARQLIVEAGAWARAAR